MLERGEFIERYEVQDLIGQGATANVYLVRHRDLHTLHALKLLTLDDNHIADRMLQEGRIQAQLRHPNIVAVTDMVRSEGRIALVMDYVDGVSLGALIDNTSLTAPQIDTIARGLFDGLEAAHFAGLVHRDLKPDNVMMEFTDRGLIPRITDFGLAKAKRGSMRAVKKTQAGTVMGTPMYMAPEQYLDAAAVNARADVFSLGAILYELVTEDTVFPDVDFAKLVLLSQKGEFTPVSEHVHDVNGDWERAIHSCLEVKPEKRAPQVASVRALWQPKRHSLSVWDSMELSTLKAMKKEERRLLSEHFSVRPTQVSTPSEPVPAPLPAPETPRRSWLPMVLLLCAAMGMGVLIGLIFLATIYTNAPDQQAPVPVETPGPVEPAPDPEPLPAPTQPAPKKPAPTKPTPTRPAPTKPAPVPSPTPTAKPTAPTPAGVAQPTVVPDPMPEPLPPAPTAVPLPTPVPGPVAAEPEAFSGVRLPAGLDGYLIGADSKRRSLDNPPPGAHVLYVFFDNQVATKAGDVDLYEGQVKVMRCDKKSRICR